jgi:hypothetical protein
MAAGFHQSTKAKAVMLFEDVGPELIQSYFIY